MSHPKFQVNSVPRLGVFEYISIIGHVLRLGPAILSAYLFGPRDQPVKVRLRNALFLHMTSSLSSRQIQATTPPAHESYLGWMREKKQQPVITELTGSAGLEKAATRLLWIGPEWMAQSDRMMKRKVMLYFHGGGFVIPMNKEYLPLMEHFRNSFKAANPEYEFSVALMEYTVTPNQQYPHQLSQASHALSHLLSIGVPPSSIILGGDSCGGHLALSLVSHILHPHPSIHPLPQIPAPLSGLILISPAVTFSTAAPAFTRNAAYDLQGRVFVERYGEYYTAGTSYHDDVAAGLYWGEPVSAPAEWWNGLESVVGRMLVTCGEKEVFVDDVVKFGEGLKRVQAVKSGAVKMEVVVGRGEVHDEPLMDFGMLGGERLKETTRCVTEFLGRSGGLV